MGSKNENLEYCTAVAGAMGLGSAFGPKILEAFAASERPTVLWLHFSDCTGCSASALRSSSRWFDEPMFDHLSLDCHEALMASSVSRAEDILFRAASRCEGRFFCVVEGAVPVLERGVYERRGGAVLRIAQAVCPKASAVIAIGTCASCGLHPASDLIPTGAKGVKDALGAKLNAPLVNLPGCPPDPLDFIGVLASFLLFGRVPELDANSRPLFAYGKRTPERRPPRAQGERRPEDCLSTRLNWPLDGGHSGIGGSDTQRMN